MSEKNRKFRNHCNIDTSINKEDARVSVSVTYKPQLLEAPGCFQRYKYNYLDVVEELSRQGIVVGDVVAGAGMFLDNTSVGGRQLLIEGNYQFVLPAPAVEAESAKEPVKKPVKRVPRAKSKSAKNE